MIISDDGKVRGAIGTVTAGTNAISFYNSCRYI